MNLDAAGVEHLSVSGVLEEHVHTLMTGNRHDLIWSRAVLRGTGHEARTQRVTSDPLRIDSGCGGVLLHDSSNVAVVQPVIGNAATTPHAAK